MVAYKFYPKLGRFVEIEPMSSQPYNSQGFPLVQQQLVGGVAMYDRRKTTRFKGPVPLRKRVNMDKNVVTYIWHSQSPSYAPYGSIAIPNYYNDTGATGTGTGAVTQADDLEDALKDISEDVDGNPVGAGTEYDYHAWPCHMYDITCAPNYVHPSTSTEAAAPDAGISEMGTGQGTGLLSLPVRNPCVAYSMYGYYKDQGVAGTPESFDKTLYYVNITNQLVSQEPDGKLGRNKWYVKYMKKPQFQSLHNANTLEIANTLPNSGGNVVGYRDLVPAGVKLTDTGIATRSIYTPPVGAKPIHLSTKVNMCLVGTHNEEVEYDISVVRFKDDAYVPNQSWDDILDATTYKKSDSNYTVGASETNTYQNQTAAALLYQSMMTPFTHGPHTKGDYKAVNKGIQILGTRRVKIAPKLVTEGDSTLNHTYVEFTLKWNEIRSMVWRNTNDQGQIPALPEYGPAGTNTRHGPGFSTHVPGAIGMTTSPGPRGRLFLMVRCRSSLRGGYIGGDRKYSQTVDGRTVGPSYEAGHTPTYDISIENSWIPDNCDVIV